MNYNNGAVCLIVFMVIRLIKEGYIKHKKQSDPNIELKEKYGLSYSPRSSQEEKEYDQELKERYGK